MKRLKDFDHTLLQKRYTYFWSSCRREIFLLPRFTPKWQHLLSSLCNDAIYAHKYRRKGRQLS